MSETEENKALVRKFYEETWVKGNADAVDEFVAADYVEHGLPTGAEGLKRSITAYRTAFPDWKTTLDDIFAEGEMVTCLWSTSGTHLGDWFGIPPTGNHFTATGISVLRIAGGKVVENWTSIDLSPSEEERRWLTEGGEWPGSGEIPATERDTSRPTVLGALTRTITWRMRVAEARERERIEQELRVARQIQQALLPETIPELDGWRIATYYGPATEVGGDFYDFLELEDGRLGLVVGDATGHGMPAALMMATPAACLGPSSSLRSRRGRFWHGSTRRWSRRYPRARSSPASMASSTQRADAFSTPTQDKASRAGDITARPTS